MYKSDYYEPSGVRLMRLINTRTQEIAGKEFSNDDRLYLYGTGGYWTAFEHSAYFLNRVFPNIESFVFNHPSYPYTIIGMSITDKELQILKKLNPNYEQEKDYIEFAVKSFAPQRYNNWHKRIVSGFLSAANA